MGGFLGLMPIVSSQAELEKLTRRGGGFTAGQLFGEGG